MDTTSHPMHQPNGQPLSRHKIAVVLIAFAVVLCMLHGTDMVHAIQKGQWALSTVVIACSIGSIALMARLMGTFQQVLLLEQSMGHDNEKAQKEVRKKEWACLLLLVAAGFLSFFPELCKPITFHAFS
jgi:hypothetical protein